jgi:hypothetical protein
VVLINILFMFYFSHTLDLVTHDAHCLTGPQWTVLQAGHWSRTQQP